MSRPIYKEEWPEFVFLSNEVTNIWFDKKLIDGLFGANKDTIDVMNRGAKEFFVALQQVLPMNLLRSISAIYDRPKTGNNANVTLEGLVLQSQMWCRTITYDACQTIFENNASAIGNLRKFRNKKLAHHDRITAISGKKLGVKISEIDSLAISAADILNHIQSDLFQSHTAFDQPIAYFPADILDCVEVKLWNRELGRLIRKEHATEAEVGSFIKYGRHNLPWRMWCKQKKIDPKYYIMSVEIPEIIS